MINDGGAERMVRKRKVTWWQILAIVLMGVMMVGIGLVFYFTINPNHFVYLMDKSALKDGYDIMREIREQYNEIAVYSYNQTNDKVTVEFRYYEEVLENGTDLIALSYSAKTTFEQYLKEHPDYFICVNQYQVELRFPDVIYRNYSDNGEKTIYTNELQYVTYEYSGISAGEFAAQLKKLKNLKELTFNGTEGHPLEFDADTDFSELEKIEGLEKLTIGSSNLTQEQKDSLKAFGEEQGVTVIVE